MSSIMRREYDLVCFDMDGTLTTVRSTWAWVHECMGVDGTPNYKAFVNGEIDIAEFMRRDIGLWLDKNPKFGKNDMIKILQSLPLIDGLQETIAALTSQGIRCVIISCGIDYAAEIIKNEFGFDDAVSTGVITNSDGTLTGEGSHLVDIRNKGIWVKKFQEKYNVSKERTVSIGNSFGDVSMFQNSGMSIAFNAIDDYTKNVATHAIDSQNISDILDLIIPNDQE